MITALLHRVSLAGAGLMLAFSLSACSPTYNWRDVNSEQGAWQAQFPAKPSSMSRVLSIDGVQVTMLMTAAETDGTTFAIGSSLVESSEQARALLAPLRKALMGNLYASNDVLSVPHAQALDFDVTGVHQGLPVRMVGRVEARGARLYQLVVLGKPGTVPPEQIEQFLTSFRAR